MRDETPEQAYKRGRKDVLDLLENERLYPRSGFDREDWNALIDSLLSSMQSNDPPEEGSLDS